MLEQSSFFFNILGGSALDPIGGLQLPQISMK